ncbi:hypothetical protein FTUN_0193 [Frigoriglobus tundricola]|uniref:Uncharacterized protein n=1 Tax=Frigoriglobus tundricola TaxID=2774151 RepID=A0A6M5YHF2_9BACT|nr:hypothetical protein FTUN_0193 [Frigoriglobus tundricola]
MRSSRMRGSEKRRREKTLQNYSLLAPLSRYTHHDAPSGR